MKEKSVTKRIVWVINMTNRFQFEAYINVNNRVFVTGFRLIIEGFKPAVTAYAYIPSCILSGPQTVRRRRAVEQSKQNPSVKVSCSRDKCMSFECVKRKNGRDDYRN